MKIYRYIKMGKVTYDLKKVKPIDVSLFLSYLKVYGENHGFWSKLSHYLSFAFYVNYNEDYINAYNYFVYRHNESLKKKLNNWSLKNESKP